MKKLNKSVAFFLVLSAVFTIGIMYFPYMYVTVSDKVNGFSIYNNFIGKDWLIDMLTIPFWYFVILILESTMIKRLKKKKHIWIFVFQGIVLLLYSYIVLKLLPYNIITATLYLTPVYYLMLLYFVLGVVINLLIAGSILDSNKNGIIKLFDKLSLLKKN